MKKQVFAILTFILAGAFAFTAQAAERNVTQAQVERTGGLTEFWNLLRQKIEQFTPRKELSASTVTGGVRGAQIKVDDLYWKGEHQTKVIAEDEYNAFQAAVARAQTGKKAEAKSSFEAFIASYPDSDLRPEAEQALEYLE